MKRIHITPKAPKVIVCRRRLFHVNSLWKTCTLPTLFRPFKSEVLFEALTVGLFWGLCAWQHLSIFSFVFFRSGRACVTFVPLLPTPNPPRQVSAVVYKYLVVASATCCNNSLIAPNTYLWMTPFVDEMPSWNVTLMFCWRQQEHFFDSRPRALDYCSLRACLYCPGQVCLLTYR